MTKQNLSIILQKYKNASAKKHQEYFRVFEKKMIYRTTKTENPETTREMVSKVLKRLSHKVCP